MSEKKIDYEKVTTDFVQITNTDEACAHFFLQDVEWDLQRGVASYFETLNEVGTEIAKQEHKVIENEKGEIIDLVDSDEEPGPSSSKARKMDPDSVKELGVVSWNIDGIEERTLSTRLNAILCIIARLNPEVIMLQEMVTDAVQFFQNKLGKMYNVIEGDTMFPYFTTVIVSKNIRIEKNSFRSFANTGMGRGLQIVECSYKGLPVKIVNCHLESMREYSEQRKVQFKELMTTLKAFEDAEPNGVVVGGGDLNIRDEEIDRYPDGIKDAWIESGMVAKERWTWDTSKNDNKFKGSVRARFDRIYFSGPLNQVEFTLHGQKRIRNLGQFPSDHWAVNCRFFRP